MLPPEKQQLLESTTGTALLIICSNRPVYLEQTLSYILKYHPRVGYPIIISEDGSNAKVKEVVDKFRSDINSWNGGGGMEMQGLSEGRVRQWNDMDPSTAANPNPRPSIIVPVIHIHHPGYHEPAVNGNYQQCLMHLVLYINRFMG